MESASEEESTTTTETEDASSTENESASSDHETGRGESSSEEGGGEPQGHANPQASGGEQEGQAGGGEQEGQASGEDGQASGGGDGGEGDDDEGTSGASSAAAVEDVSSLPGETVNDQDGRKIGEVKEVYGVGDDETPMWVTIESATGLGRSRDVFVPLARIKKQKDEFRVPYSYSHIHESPEVDAEDELSEEDDRALRAYYAIGLADQELVGSAQSYASQVPDDDGPARKMDADSAEGPVREIDDTPPAERVAEAYEKQKEEEGEEHRKGKDTTADEIFQEDGADGSDGKSDGESEEEKSGSEEKEKSGGSEEEKQEPKGSSGESAAKDESSEKSSESSDEKAEQEEQPQRSSDEDS
jgi:hypothetical protein